MKSTLKVHDVLGIIFVTGEVSMDDFIDSGESRLNECVVREGFMGNGFRESSAYFTKAHFLPGELVEEMNKAYELKQKFGLFDKLETLSCRIQKTVSANVGRVRKLESAQERINAANAEMARWIEEDMEAELEQKKREMIDHIGEICEKINQDSARRLATHAVQNIDDDMNEGSVLECLKSLVEKCTEALKDAKARELAERKRLCIEWLYDDSGVPHRLREIVEEKITGRNRVYDTLGSL